MDSRAGQGSTGARRLSELSWLNTAFCLMVIYVHVASHPVSALDPMSWQYAAVLLPQKLFHMAVPGFFLLSGVKLTLPRRREQSLPAYWGGRLKAIYLPYLIAALVYYLVFVYVLKWFPFSLTDFLGYVVRGNLSAPFYFLIALAQFILLAPLFRWAAKRWSPAILLPFALGVTWLSTLYFNGILQFLMPGAAWFEYTDRVFTSYLIYFMAGCSIGAHYGEFTSLLRKNRPLITALFVLLSVGYGATCVLHFSGRRYAGYLEILSTLYAMAALLFLFSAAIELPPLPKIVAAIDRASYPIYLYHCLVMTLFNDWAARAGITKVSVLFFLRAAVVYGVTIPCAVGLQQLWRRAAGKLKPKTPSH